MDKKQVSAILEQMAVLLELKGENPFKIRAYSNGARLISLLQENLGDLVAQQRLGQLKGIGKSLAELVTELVTTGSAKEWETLQASFPAGLMELMQLQGLGPKKVKVLYQELGISSLAELEYACNENRLLELKGFGKKTQENLCQAIKYRQQFQGQYLSVDVHTIALELLEYLRSEPDCIRAELAGSLRRAKPVVKDIDLVVATDKPQALGASFAKQPFVAEVVAQGDTKVSVRLLNGVMVDVRLVETEEFATAWHHFTGSKEHNTALRQRAKARGVKLNEYGIFKEPDQSLTVESEAALFQALGLAYIPPELRENMGELEAAETGKLPKLIEVGDLKGVIHVHTLYSDGVNSIEELVLACQERGFSYLGITDHSKTAFYAHGLKEDAIKRQWEEIDRLNEKYQDFTIFKGIESDILPDGSLDYDLELLAGFDLVIGSIHSNLRMSKEQATQRLLRAMDNPYLTMLGHLTGRLLLGRAGYEVDMEAIIEKAKATKTIIELNASPHRLDVNWQWLKRLQRDGILISINADAHRLERFDDLPGGVSMARKGWLEAKDVANTLTAVEFRALCQSIRALKGAPTPKG